MNIGEHIKTIREKKKLSQKHVALSVNMDPSQYSKIEKGKTDPSVSTLERIAKALDITLGELFQNENIFKEVDSASKTIMEKLKIVEQLDEQERNSIYNIIDGLFTKKRMRDSLSSALNNAS